MSRFSAEMTPLLGLTCLTRQQSGDERGYFSRLFCVDALTAYLEDRKMAQINLTFTAERGVVRGLHFQYPPHAEMKMVSCLRGEVWDVAVDLRADSPTFLQWHGEVLSATNRRSFLIPEGFAHGIQSLSPEVEMFYCHTAAYAPEAEGALHPEDETLAIPWPLAISSMSDRDRSHPRLNSQFTGLKF